MGMNFKKKNITITAISIMLLLIIVFAVIFNSSFAYDSIPTSGLNDSEILNCLEIKNDNFSSYLSKISLVPDNNGFTLLPFKINITNKCKTYLTYNIKIAIKNNTYDLNNLYYNITESDYKLNSINKLGSSNNEAGTYLLYIGDLNGEESKTIELRMWTNIDNTNLTLNGDLSIDPLHSLTPAPHGWYAAKEGTLINSIKSNYEVTKTTTLPGKEVSKVTEKELASTTDNYGTSYYFRGAIDNNYVVFANMCWRVVRISGDGSIKMTLYNNNKYNAPNPCNFGLDESDAAFAIYSNDNYQSTFNSKTDDNAYVGLMYGTSNVKDYKNTHANKNKSIILQNLESWYLNNIFKYDYYLADETTCTDKSVFNGSINSLELSGPGYAKENTWYSTSNRLINKIPNLDCASESSLSLKQGMNYKVGLLSADEVAMAGATYQKDNTSYYLYHNANGNNYWTSSPALFNEEAINWRVGASGGLYYSKVNNSYAIRPTVSLRSNIKVTGYGTSSNPYIVSLDN